LNGLFVPLTAVCGEGIAIKVSTRNPVSDCLHLRKQCAIEAVVVSVGGEKVVACKRRIGLKLVVAIETGLSAQKRKRRSARCSVASDTQTTGDHVTTGLNTQDGEKNGEVVAYVVYVLLGIDQLIEGGNTIMGKEVVLHLVSDTTAYLRWLRRSDLGTVHEYR
jgi:hypothetical protein